MNIVSIHLYIAWIIQSESPGLLRGLPNLTDTKESTYFGIFMENVIESYYLTHSFVESEEFYFHFFFLGGGGGRRGRKGDNASLFLTNETFTCSIGCESWCNLSLKPQLASHHLNENHESFEQYMYFLLVHLAKY